MKHLVWAAFAAIATAPAARADTILATPSATPVVAGAETTDFGAGLYATLGAVTLADGTAATLSDAGGDQVVSSGNGFSPLTGSYAGQFLAGTGQSETIAFSRPLAAFGLFVSPSVGLFPLGGSADTVTITLSNGQTASLNDTFVTGQTDYVGFTGPGDVTSITLAVANAASFGFGDFTDAVPEPGSLALTLVGVPGIVGLRRRLV